MASSDPKQGGDLFDMAKDGTTMPNDAGKMNLIPSVPRPDQMTDDNNFGNNLGADSLAGAADNPTDISRSNKDIGMTGEAITGTGNTLPAEAETKRLHFSGGPLDKGHQRYDKHTRDKESHLERLAGDGAGMQDDEDIDVGSRDERENKEV
ncbi:hypothetical protein MMC34_004805 [Xylographa carneopallida]|nr:hypothetical protein [Xylographa carneopallida]